MKKEICLSITTVLIFLSFLTLSSCKKSIKKSYSGVFFANDCGVSHGGFEWVGEYSAKLKISGDEGTLELVLSLGLGDPLHKHLFSVKDFFEGAGYMSFKLEGRKAELELIERDLIWGGRFDGYFTGIKSDDAKEKIGKIPIEVFDGFQAHYYLDLRLKPEVEKSLFSSSE